MVALVRRRINGEWVRVLQYNRWPWPTPRTVYMARPKKKVAG